MVVLSYDSAKRTLLMMAIYLICASLIVKGMGTVIESSFLFSFPALVSGGELNFTLPEVNFNLETLSFDMIANTIREKIQGIVNLTAETALGMLNYIHFSNLAANKLVVTRASKVVFRV